MFLTNLSTSSRDLKWFNGNWHEVIGFLRRHGLDGIELILHGEHNLKNIPPNLVQGMHLRYWPVWLDFWREDQPALLRQFGNEENIKMLYGGLKPQCLVDHYKKEFKIARQLKAKYVVFHVSHVELSHIYNWKFSYNDHEVLEATAELINEVFQGDDEDIILLFENLWWPGLNFLNPDYTGNFFDKIQYNNKGFMLDIGHLMITNPRLKNEMEAKDYIIDKIELLGEVKDFIKGIHINKAICGAYLQQDHSAKAKKLDKIENIWDKFIEARSHILNMDLHIPFDHPSIQEVIDFINPRYVVFEVVAKDLQEFEHFIQVQNQALGRCIK